MKSVTLNEENNRKLCSQNEYDDEKVFSGSERFSLRLPSSFTTTCADDSTDVTNLMTKSVEELIAVVSGNGNPSRRYHAGMLLSLVGDPRISINDPAMVSIASGSYSIGSTMESIAHALSYYANLDLEEKWLLKEHPQHNVEVAGFLIGKYPVTNGEYLEFLVATQYDRLPTSWVLGRFPTEKRNHPVFNVLPEDAMAYIEWLNFETERQFRLPTEIEWEVAASGGNGQQYPWGETFDPQNCNTIEGNILGSTPVGMYEGVAPCANDLCDMAGNVEEYVSDDYRPYPGGDTIKDHLNEGTDHYRVARGGSFGRFGDLARCQRRHGLFPESVRAIFPMGFRLAEVVS